METCRFCLLVLSQAGTLRAAAHTADGRVSRTVTTTDTERDIYCLISTSTHINESQEYPSNIPKRVSHQA